MTGTVADLRHPERSRLPCSLTRSMGTFSKVLLACIAAVILVSSSTNHHPLSARRTCHGPWCACATCTTSPAGTRACCARWTFSSTTIQYQTRPRYRSTQCRRGPVVENQAGNAHLVTDEPRTHSRWVPWPGRILPFAMLSRYEALSLLPARASPPRRCRSRRPAGRCRQ